MSTPARTQPSNGTRLARNTAFNLAGQALPLLAGVALIPYIMRGLGPDRFGMLGIVWVVFGYFSLMDLGLGRATTKFLAELLAKGEAAQISDMVWSSILLQLCLGVAGGIIILCTTPLLVEHVLRTPKALVAEARTAFYILAAALPIVLAMSGLRAVLEGCERFDITNLLRVPSGILAFGIPAIAVAAGLKLPGVVLWMAVSRTVFTFIYGYHCFRVLPCLKTRPTFRANAILPLLSFGGWVTASNIVNPILLSADRFLIGSLISVAMVGYYTAPFEAVTRLWVVPVSLMTTVYPAASAFGIGRKRELQALYSRTMKYIFCALGPVILVLILFARPIIGVWLGASYVTKSAVPLQLLAVGVFINSFAHVPYCFLQSLGRPDAIAKLLIAELLPYGFLLWWMIQWQGISGAAAAWAIRVTVEVLLLLWIARRALSLSASRTLDRRMWTAIGSLAGTGVAIWSTTGLMGAGLLMDAAVSAFWLTAFALTVWKWALDGADRASALALLGPLRNTSLGRFLEGAEAS